MGKTNDKRIVNGPYLLAPEPGQVTVAWETEFEAPMAVRYSGADQGTAMAEVFHEPPCPECAEGYYLYTAVLVGLTPGENYSYEVCSGEEILASAGFKSLEENPETLRMVTVSDSHLFYTEKQFSKMIDREKPDMILHGGDISFGTGYQHEQYVNNWFSKIPEVLRSTPAYYIPGNHDDGPFENMLFITPQAKTVNTADGGHTYSFDYGCTHFVMVDSNPWGLFEMNAVNSGIQADAATKRKIKNVLEWIEADLNGPAAKKAKWRVLICHHPYTDVFNNQYLVPLVERCGLDLMIAGHLHYYIKSISVDPEIGARTVYVCQGSTQDPDAEFSGKNDEKRLLGDFPEVTAMGRNNYGLLEITEDVLEYKLYGFQEQGEDKLVDTVRMIHEEPCVEFSDVDIIRQDNNGNVEIRAFATNKGQGAAEAVLEVIDNNNVKVINLFGDEDNSHVVLLEPGESKKVCAKYRAVEPGEHELSAGDSHLHLVVFEPTQLSYQHMSVVAGKGEQEGSILAGIEATNNLDREIFVSVPLYINQRVAESRNIFFRGHEKKYIEFSYHVHQGGSYQVSIGDRLPKEVQISGGIRIIPRIRDKSGNGHTALLHGSPKVITKEGLTYVKLEEYGDYIEIPASPDLESPQGFTGMVWANVDRLAKPQEMGHNPLMVRGKSVGWGATYYMRMVIERAGGLKFGTCHDITEYAWQGGHADVGNWMHYSMSFDKNAGGSSYCNGENVAHVPGISEEDTLRQWEKEPIFVGYSYIGHVIPEIGRPKYYTHLPGSVSQVRFYKKGLTEAETQKVYEAPEVVGPESQDLAVWLDFKDILTVGKHTTEWRHPAVYSKRFMTEKKLWKFYQLKAKAVLPLQAGLKALIQVSDDGTSVKGELQITLNDGSNYFDISSLPKAQYIRIVTDFTAEVGADGTFVPELSEYQVTASNDTDFTNIFWSTREDWSKGTFTGAVGFAPVDRLKDFPEYTDVIHG